MAIHLKQQKGDVLAGVIGLRGPDGTIIRTVKFYREAPDDAAVKPGKLTESEQAVCDGIVRDMVEMFGQYVESVKALEAKG